MGVIYSNMPLTKETSEPTILQMFINNENTLSIRDFTTLIYTNKKKLYRNFNFSKDNNEYIIKLLPEENNDGTILGLHFAEGYDIRVDAPKEPIFLQKNTNIDMDLKGFLNPDKKIKRSTVGVYRVGTKITYLKKGISYVDTLSDKGWKSTYKRRIESVSDVAKEKNKKALTNLEKRKKIEELFKNKEISLDLYYRYRTYLGENKKIDLNFVTIEEVKMLKQKGL